MKYTCFFILNLFFSNFIFSQVYLFTSEENGKVVENRILMDNEYFIQTSYISSPPTFIKTLGGFYSKEGASINVALEFNSNFTNDSIKLLTIDNQNRWVKISKPKKLLQGKWLMAGRVTDDGERRRDLTRSRKTMKFLIDGYFQWIAFDTSSFRFSGSGGGEYETIDGKYKEKISYFSRDNNRVGIELIFDYKLKGFDWYHKGLSSKGDPFHEIWTRRISQD